MQGSTKQWAEYFELISAFYKYVDKHSNKTLYQHNDSPFNPIGSIKHTYRAIIQLSNAHQLDSIERKIDRIVSTYYEMIEDETKPLPQYIPRLTTDDTLHKIQIHENVAHTSKNYKEDTLVPIALWLNTTPTNDIELRVKNEERGLISNMLKVLESNGYEPTVDKKLMYNEVLIKTNVLLEKFNCDSVQHRRQTGMQIRANYFNLIDGFLTKSKLASVGVLLIPYDFKVQVFKSPKRKIRSDAIYNKFQSNEIQLEEVPLSLRYGKHYAK